MLPHNLLLHLPLKLRTENLLDTQAFLDLVWQTAHHAIDIQALEQLEAAADFVPDLHPADATPELRGLAEVCLVLLNASEFAYVY